MPKNGFNGRTKKMHGADGEDYIVQVPLPSLKNSENGEVIGDLVEIGQRVIVAHGGKGGRGGNRFTTSPRNAEFGESGRTLHHSRTQSPRRCWTRRIPIRRKEKLQASPKPNQK